MDHVGANICLGGVKEGSGIVVYHVFVDFITMGAPLIPPATEVETHAMAARDGGTQNNSSSGDMVIFFWKTLLRIEFLFVLMGGI